MTVSRSARTIQRAAIPSGGRCWPGGIPTGNFSATIPSATSWLKRAPHDLKRRVEQRDLYMLAEPTAMPRDQRGDNAVRGHKRGIARGQRHCAVDRVGRHGRQAWVVQSGGSRYNALPAGKTGGWIVGCEAGQRAEDQARMALGRKRKAVAENEVVKLVSRSASLRCASAHERSKTEVVYEVAAHAKGLKVLAIS